MKWDYKESQKLQEHVMQTITYSIACEGCSKIIDDGDYESSLAQDAFYADFRVIEVNDGDSFPFCKKCRDNKIPENWGK